MALSVFDDKDNCPTAREVECMLGGAAAAWRRLVARIAERHPPIAERWTHAGKSFGWSLRLVQRDRVVLYLTPRAGSFLVGVVLGERAVEAVRAAGLPDAVLALIEAAPRYAEGRGVRVAVSGEDGVVLAERLAAIKLGPPETGARASRRRG